MALSHGRVVKVGETLYPHEQEGIAFAIGALPDHDPYHLWALVDLLDPSTGRLHEIDLLVMGYSCLYLVELKAFAGRMEGDAVDWTWVTPEGRRIWRENPLRLTRRKAQVLKSRLERALPSDVRAPWIEPLVFLSHEHIALALQPDGLTGVVRRDNFAAAITHHDFPGATPRSGSQRLDTRTQRAVVAALEQIGVRPRKGKFFVGPYVLGELLSETNAYQDRLATHRDLKGMTRRARTYLVPEQTSIERRQQLRRAADREAQLLYEVGGHPNILTYAEYVTDAPLGPTVLLEAFDDGVPLDSFLRQHPALIFGERIALIEQLGRALDHCHKKGVVHGGVCPAAFLVRRNPDSRELGTRLYNFQLGKGDSVTGTSHATDLAADAWALYQAPELGNDSALRTIEADIFALGAVAFLVLTGKEPAADLVERAEVLRTRRCLDPRAIDESVPEPVAQLVCQATEEVVASRADDAGDWVEMLLAEATAPDAPRKTETSPLEARAGDMVGPYLMEGVLGHGASARVLQVSDEAGRQLALKVSLGAEHDERLRAEAAVLDRLNHPRIVRLLGTHTFAERTCLLMTLAGERTLYRELADQGSLSLDYASRWGEDLLSALEHLEEREVVHRDIKPANLGVGTVAKKARTLHLFDFSLASSPMSELRVGTAAYRDPFLPQRTMWDHAADRFSAAVTLHEILTGVRPGRHDDGTLEIAAERFDAGARAALLTFFTTAFRPAAADRFESADAMRHAWIACFGGRTQVEAATDAPEPELAPLTDEAIRAVTPDTAIAAMPLSARARNALDRAGLLVAGGLLALPDNRLSAIRGVGRDVAKQIHEFRTRWQALRPLEAERGATFFPGYQGGDLLVAVALAERDANVLADAGLHTLVQVAGAPASHIEALASRHGLDADAVTARLRAENQSASERNQPTTLEAWLDVLFAGKRKQDQHVRAVMGLDGEFAGRLDVTPRMVANHLHYTVPPIYVALTKAKQVWAGHPTLPILAERVRAHVRDQGGAVALEAAAEWLLSDLPHDTAAEPAMLRVRAAAVLRAITEVDKGDDVAGLRYARLAGDRPWLLTSADLTAELRQLGLVADRLADREVLAGPSETDRALREVIADKSPFAALPADRLVRLAAAASDHAAASPRLELYPRGMPAERALKLSANALGGGLTPDDLVRRIAARYPAADALPPRPTLDTLVQTLVGLEFDPKANRYARPGERLVSTVDTKYTSLTRVSQLTPQSISDREIELGDFDDRLKSTIERRSLLVLGVPTDLAQVATEILVRRMKLLHHSFDAHFLAAMDTLVAAQEIDPAVVLETDADGPRADAWRYLTDLSTEAASRVATTLLPPKRPILITEPGLIHRYQLEGFLRTLVAASQDDAAAAIVLLCPGHGGQRGRAPTIEGEMMIPGLLPGQSAWIPVSWLTDYRKSAA